MTVRWGNVQCDPEVAIFVVVSMETLFIYAGLQEMLAIMKSIYDMMGRYTYPTVRDDAPSEHVEKFFQVCFQWFLCIAPFLPLVIPIRSNSLDFKLKPNFL